MPRDATSKYARLSTHGMSCDSREESFVKKNLDRRADASSGVGTISGVDDDVQEVVVDANDLIDEGGVHDTYTIVRGRALWSREPKTDGRHPRSGYLLLPDRDFSVKRLEFMAAHFSTSALPESLDISLDYAIASSPCSPSRVEVSGQLAVVRSSIECHAQDKARRAHDAGAKLLIIISNDELIYDLPSQESLPSSFMVKMPTIMVSAAAGSALEKGLGKIGLLPDFDVEHNWREIIKLWKPGQWPSQPKAQRKLYHRMRKFHAAKFSTGSEERERALEASYRRTLS